ncbi:MAG: CPBP family glutamic-type intramembrane protease [Kiritimatiellaeota bacterium]|nr:CPBP family glutamic-type intramembrane protease [Kiritimatiellota bacterium]
MNFTRTSVFIRWGEFVFLYVAVPVLVTFCLPAQGAIPALWGGALLAWWLVKRTPEGDALLLDGEARVPLRRALGGILLRFAVGAALLTGLLLWLHPGWLLEFPHGNPKLWGVVCVAYPVLSVFPQVIIYRVLFIRRYSSLFASKRLAWLVGAMVFGWAHLPFRNPFALVFPFVGGFLFIHTYQRTRSVPLNILEHGLYGCFLFTIGWGQYFFYGTQALLAN